MDYVLNLFTPATWSAFLNHGADITGFSRTHLSRARNLVKPGDTFICYMVRLSRWCGALKVLEGPFEDDTPIFEKQNDPWVVRFRVEQLVSLSAEQAIPIRSDLIWHHLERTKAISLNSPSWPVRAGLQSSLVRINEVDGSYLLKCLREQRENPAHYPLTEADHKYLSDRTDVVSTPSGPISVLVPDSAAISDELLEQTPDSIIRRSLKVQATLVGIGIRVGFEIWVPRADRSRVVCQLSTGEEGHLVNQLPLNYNDATLKTIENIDVLWLRKRRIVRAFEVEHTTAIYSGLLRMADLLALQPNIDIKLHIVAPEDRRERVLEEIRRPVFSLLEKGPLSESCSYLPYEAIDDLYAERHLGHMTDSIIEEFAEYASES